ncbi:hypothetical protein LPJ70_002671 [Coemansia sp. RSA 2708]|nr:hypothetical protein LPJ70_002671 [Coemansia sp. RSA 2708]KAJ2303531.1 hypothetical protein IWW54_005693 [Coemansia sp. RSA 2705]KAJ2310511.1 hypothetical protein IWW52_005392 [Coemansia sp. RSA 2704]KAJ2717436.1 hypothetical protein H4R23_005316 [Coemansia sp. Cherry 401B]
MKPTVESRAEELSILEGELETTRAQAAVYRQLGRSHIFMRQPKAAVLAETKQRLDELKRNASPKRHP